MQYPTAPLNKEMTFQDKGAVLVQIAPLFVYIAPLFISKPCNQNQSIFDVNLIIP